MSNFNVNNSIQMLGWQFNRDQQQISAPFITQDNEDVSYVLGSSYFGGANYYLSLDQSFTNENDLIRKYRDMALHPELDEAINDIVNEAMHSDGVINPVDIDTDDLELSDNVKENIHKEFDKILKLLNFKTRSYDLFRRWYIDGKLYFYIVINESKTKREIKELRYISPLKIKKIREEKEKLSEKGIPLVENINEFYIYYKDIAETANTNKNMTSTAIKLSKDSVCCITSGFFDEERNITYSYLHKAIKPLNQLRMVEDASIIYRLARAPERRVFYVDVGNLPKQKAEEYLAGIKAQQRNKMTYDAITGEVRDTHNVLSMMEDLYMPRREGGRGTEVSTLPSGQSLGEIDDIEYFRKKLYMSLNVPMSRLASNEATMMGLGRVTEVSRDEMKFSKFINRLRIKFSELFYTLLKTQLLLKGLITEKEWNVLSENIRFEYESDSYFTEIKDSEILKERMSTFESVQERIGVDFSLEWVRKNILMMTEEEIKQEQKQIKKELKNEPSVRARVKELMGEEEFAEMMGEKKPENEDTDKEKE